MKKLVILLSAIVFFVTDIFAQSGNVGIGTNVPNSRLQVEGSIGVAYRTVTSSTTLGVSDYAIEFTGSSAATITLPDDTSCKGRIYTIKNNGTGNPTPELTISPYSGQTIEGGSSWKLRRSSEVFTLMSSGINWQISNHVVPVQVTDTTGDVWSNGGNSSQTATTRKFGMTTNNDVAFITNNTERMRITNTGNVGVNTSSPNSTLDVKGSLSVNYRSFTGATTASATDNALTFTGSSAATLTLPDATNCTGRTYSIKNLSTTVPTPVLTIGTTSSQTIDMNSSKLLYLPNQSVNVVSNGANWVVTSTSGTLGGQPYGSVSSSVNQTVSSTSTSRLITYDTDEILNLITHSTTVNPSRIYVDVDGVYLITFSAELRGAAADIDIWLRQNGADVPRSNSRSSLQNGNDYRLLVVTFIMPAVANDYFELVQSSTNTSAGLAAIGAGTNPTRPAIPSIIVTINKVSD